MTKDHLEYKGHEITIVDDKESDESAEVIIDEKHLRVFAEETGYYTRFLPYRQYASLDSLSKDVVDHWPTIKTALEEEDGA